MSIRSSAQRSVCSLTAMLCLIIAMPVYGQDSSELDLFELSLEELSSQVIVTASKREETLFTSPMAANVITGQAIANSGATSIPEALRLVPGLIVREQSSGNYDVHIRGLDNIPPGSIFRFASNSLTLVMIDGREVFNHFTGGTFWEALPITVADIDRIEVVRGAASASYGPNAVTGVIHILTKDPAKTRDTMVAQLEVGNHETYIGSGSLGFESGEQWQGRFSANWQHRDRQSDHYYDLGTARYLDNPADIVPVNEVIEDIRVNYPYRSKGSERNAANVYLRGGVDEDSSYTISFGYQNAEVQKIYDDNAATPLSTVETESWYINIGHQWKDWRHRMTYESGNSDTLGYTFGFDYSNLNYNLDTDLKFDKLLLQPSFQYRKQEYSGAVFGGNEESMEITSLGLRSDYVSSPWRFIAALRGDYYDFSSETEISFQFAVAYSFSDKLIYRFNYSRANQEPSMTSSFEDITFAIDGLRVLGNQELDVLTVDNLELGVRWQMSNQWAWDIELFSNEAEDYQDIFFNGAIDNNGLVILQDQNLQMDVKQTGLSATLHYSAARWNGMAYYTWQETDINNWSPLVFFTPTPPRDIGNENTPSGYGGMVINYQQERWNFNMNTYYYGSYQQVSRYNTVNPGNTGKVDGKWIMNSKLSYAVTPNLDAFINLRNLLDDDEVEFSYADDAGALYIMGFTWRI